MLWSVMPENLVMQGLDAGLEPEYGLAGSCLCRFRRGADGNCVIERLISTDPADYLRRELAPGQRLPQQVMYLR